jgi:hypothetical protein
MNDDFVYPLFFPTFSPIDGGYACDWWWSDPEIATEDVGPFLNRSDAVQSWALYQFENCLESEFEAMDQILQSPLLNLTQSSQYSSPSQAMPALRRNIQSQSELLQQGLQALTELESLHNQETTNLLQEVIA